MSRELIDEYLAAVAAEKATWGPGPWNDEPDREDFKAQGFACFVQRNHFGAWCGYVGVPPGHPLHGKGYDDGTDFAVHGGVSYSGACTGGICHVPEPGEPDALWWFGFDCSHAFDVTPGLRALFRGSSGIEWLPGEHYRTLAYVRSETERLAAQIAEKP